ncbi:leucine-rich repeat domain-containing protein [Ascoidea rubescens DSM 1968]|uniref:L domain-like protein n=1 Tax=Ascoidea rubescens DSM 1968 TaxID=1344418 RepID=A0A1D2VH12_9ASCO|nr:L domain-like protein [Ascoidea rubescens DSM 1968]ODV60948.1 L domain-like protein [Ascoidea rubescens DSM 1968]
MNITQNTHGFAGKIIIPKNRKLRTLCLNLNSIGLFGSYIDRYLKQFKMISVVTLFESLEYLNLFKIKFENLNRFKIIDLFNGDYFHFYLNKSSNQFRLRYQFYEIDLEIQKQPQLMSYLNQEFTTAEKFRGNFLSFFQHCNNYLNSLRSISYKIKNTNLPLINYNFDRLPYLKSLNLSDNCLTVIPKFPLLLNLKYLNLSNNLISRLENLFSLYNLGFLILSQNRIEKIENLSNQELLKKFDMSQNRLSDIEELANVTNLQFLNLSYNRISKLKNLTSLRNLESFICSFNSLENLRGISALYNIKDLDLSHNKLNHSMFIDELLLLKNLKKLTISERHFSNNDEISKVLLLLIKAGSDRNNLITQNSSILKKQFLKIYNTKKIDLFRILNGNGRRKSVELKKIFESNFDEFNGNDTTIKKLIFELIKKQVDYVSDCISVLSAGEDFLQQDHDIVKPYSQEDFHKHFFVPFGIIVEEYKTDLVIPLVKLFVVGEEISGDKWINVFRVWASKTEENWLNFLSDFCKVSQFFEFTKGLKPYVPNALLKFDEWKDTLTQKKIIETLEFNYLTLEPFDPTNTKIFLYVKDIEIELEKQNIKHDLRRRCQLFWDKMKNITFKIDRAYTFNKINQMQSLLNYKFTNYDLQSNFRPNSFFIWVGKTLKEFRRTQQKILFILYINAEITVVSFLLEKYCLEFELLPFQHINCEFKMIKKINNLQCKIRIYNLITKRKYKMIVYNYVSLFQKLDERYKQNWQNQIPKRH